MQRRIGVITTAIVAVAAAVAGIGGAVTLREAVSQPIWSVRLPEGWIGARTTDAKEMAAFRSVMNLTTDPYTGGATFVAREIDGPGDLRLSAELGAPTAGCSLTPPAWVEDYEAVVAPVELPAGNGIRISYRYGTDSFSYAENWVITVDDPAFRPYNVRYGIVFDAVSARSVEYARTFGEIARSLRHAPPDDVRVPEPGGELDNPHVAPDLEAALPVSVLGTPVCPWSFGWTTDQDVTQGRLPYTWLTQEVDRVAAVLGAEPNTAVVALGEGPSWQSILAVRFPSLHRHHAGLEALGTRRTQEGGRILRVGERRVGSVPDAMGFATRDVPLTTHYYADEDTIFVIFSNDAAWLEDLVRQLP